MDFRRKRDRAWALRLLREQRPTWVISAPPCTAFTVLNQNVNYPKMAPQEMERRMQEGLLHLKFVAKIYRFQMRHNKYVLHEHPKSARSWSSDPIKSILKMPDVFVTK